MKLEDFNPVTPELEVNGIMLSFNKFSLYEKAWAMQAFSTKEEPNGLLNLSKGLETLDAVVIARFAWRLVSNKKAIEQEDFYKYAESSRNLVEVLQVINNVLIMSQNTAKVNERMRELKKS